MTQGLLSRFKPRRNLGHLTRGLGWFSIGLGITEVLAPHKVGRALGVKGREALIVAYGVREIVAGVGVLQSKRPARWLWGRVAGDVLDLLTLGSWAADSRRKTAPLRALSAVTGVTLLDVGCARAAAAQERKQNPRWDYSDRSGFPRPPEMMRGAAVQPGAHSAQALADSSSARHRAA